MAKFIYQSKKKSEKMTPPLPPKEKKTPKRMKYFVNVIILVKIFFTNKCYPGPLMIY